MTTTTEVTDKEEIGAEKEIKRIEAIFEKAFEIGEDYPGAYLGLLARAEYELRAWYTAYPLAGQARDARSEELAAVGRPTAAALEKRNLQLLHSAEWA